MRTRQTLRYRDLLKRKDIASIMGIGLIYALSVLLILILLREIFLSLQSLSGGGGNGLPWELAALACLTLINSAMRALEFIVPETISLRVVHSLRLRIYAHMTGMAPRQIQHRSRGSLILRLTGDLTMLRTWISRGLSRGGIALLSALACLVAIATFSPVLAGAVTGCFVGGTIISLVLGRRLQSLTARVRRRRSLLTSNLDEQVHALAVIQINGRTVGEASRLQKQSMSMTIALQEEAVLRGLLRGVSVLTGWVALVAALVIGSFQVAAGHLDLGAVLTTLIAVRLLQGFVRSIGLAHDYWRRAEISRKKLDDFLGSSTRRLRDPELRKLTRNRATIVFDGVTVHGALADFSAVVPAGQQVAIVGPTGSGKSTVLQSLAQMVHLDDGSITVGGQLLAECQISSIYRKIGMVSPDMPLMRGTLRRNLTYRTPRATDAELRDLLDRCQLNQLIASFEDGLDHWVTEGGANLPLGARHRLVLARALLGNPPILVLDEAVTRMDEQQRKIYRDIIARYAGTILNVTNDPADIANADIVWTMADGRLTCAEPAGDYLLRIHRLMRQTSNLSLVN